jgi:hypothetical protein
MTLFCKLSRKHYWCTPHRSEDKRLVQVCYECGAERQARELHTEKLPDGVHRAMPKTTNDLTRAVGRSARAERPPRPQIAIGPVALSRLTLVK